MCVAVVRASVLMGNYTHVLTYVAKAEQTPDADDPLVLLQLRACAGLAQLEGGKFKQAAAALTQCAGELGMPELLLPRDVALCGGLCALAALSRSELRSSVLESHAFRGQLELCPALREAIFAFHAARYATCLERLAQLKPELLLEPFLRPHADKLLGLVRTKALVAYFAPYATVSMAAMAASFSQPLPELEAELAKLITDGTIRGRIDSAAKVLLATAPEQRSISFRKAAAMGDEYAHECQVQSSSNRRTCQHRLHPHVREERAGPGDAARSCGRAARPHVVLAPLSCPPFLARLPPFARPGAAAARQHAARRPGRTARRPAARRPRRQPRQAQGNRHVEPQ